MVPHYHKEERRTIPPKKNLGQNFLVNKNKIREIVRALEPRDGDTIVEIGPGHGELTRELITDNKKLRLIAIEKDPVLAQELIEEIGGARTDIIAGDALKILPRLVLSHGSGVASYKLVGNIPYYITGFLLRIIGESKNKPSVAVLTVQKEVAERIAAKPPRMNLLAATVQYWAEAEIIDIIPKTDFFPVPKVDSAILRLKVGINESGTGDTENYCKLVKILFKQPRKTVLNNLRGSKNIDVIGRFFNANGISVNDRPQDLSVKDIKQMSVVMYNETK